MPFNFAAAKALARRRVHDTMAVDATYLDTSLAQPEPLRVRWHNQLAQDGDLESTGYSNVIVGVNRIVFDRDELNAKGVTPRRGGRVTLATGEVLMLAEADPDCGAIEHIWNVGKA